jgi:hypothetical protein
MNLSIEFITLCVDLNSLLISEALYVECLIKIRGEYETITHMGNNLIWKP